jgi:hypothetical protein
MKGGFVSESKAASERQGWRRYDLHAAELFQACGHAVATAPWAPPDYLPL